MEEVNITENIDPDIQEYETDYQPESAPVNQSIPGAEHSAVSVDLEGDDSSGEALTDDQVSVMCLLELKYCQVSVAIVIMYCCI